MKKKRRSKSKPPVVVLNPEDGWDDKLTGTCMTNDYDTQEPKERRT